MSRPSSRVEPSTFVEAVEFKRLAAEAHQARDVTLQRASSPAQRHCWGGTYCITYAGRLVYAADSLDSIRSWLRL